MSDADETRVLNMRINNKTFLKGAADSLKALTTLNKGIDGAGKGKGMQNMAASVDTVKNKFSVMQIAGVTALATIASRAVNAGLNMVKAMTITPILDGFREYEKLLTSTQTIMANTGKSAQTVGKYLDDLNHYSDQTIYNFGQMADNIGKFTAAGVNIKDATSSIKGLANTAALSGSNTEQLNTAMYQMSQALSTGTIKLMDWNSLANAGMGGSNIREALMATTRSLGGNFGAAMDASIKKNGSFRDSLRDGWLTADTFNKTMKVMAGTTDKATGKTVAFSVAQLKSMGYTAEAAKELHKLSGAAIESATKIKTFSQLMDVVKESIGSGWSQIFRALFGDLEQAGEMWTNVGNTITGALGNMFGGISSILQQWRELGGFEKFWAGIGNIFKSLGNVFAPFVTAFKSIMPASEGAGSTLFKLTDAFYKFSVWLERVTSKASQLTPILSNIGQAIGRVFGFVTNAGGEAAEAGEKVGGVWEKLLAIFGSIAGGIISAASVVTDAIGQVFSTIFDQFKDGDGMDWSAVFSTLFAGGVVAGVAKFMKSLMGIADQFSGFGNVIKETFGQLTETLAAMQAAVRSVIILNIAVAVALLAGSLLLLSNIPAGELAKGLGSIAAIMALLIGSMAAMSAIKGGFSLVGLSAGLVLISTSLLMLAGAVAAFGNMDIKTLAKGFVSIGVALGILATFAAVANKGGVKLAALGVALTILSGGLLLLSSAVLAFGLMDNQTLYKGFASIAAGLTLLSVAALVLSKAKSKVIIAAGAMVVMSFALTALAGAVALYATMDWNTLGSGLAKMGVALGAMVIGMLVLSKLAPSILIASASLVALSLGMTAIFGAITLFSGMSWGDLASGLGKMAVTLVAIGLAAQVASPGIIALGIGVAILGAGMLAIGAGLTLAGAGFAAIAVAGSGAVAILIDAVGGFIALVPDLGASFAEAFVKILETVSKNAPKIIESLVKIGIALLDGFDELTPRVIESVLSLIVALAEGLAEHVPEFVDAGADLITGLLDGLAENMDEIVTSATNLVTSLLGAIGDNSEAMTTAGGQLILDLLTAINTAVQTYTEPIVAMGRQIAWNLIKGIVLGLIPDPIQEAFVSLVTNIVDFFKGLLGINSPSTVFAGFGRNIVEGLANGVRNAISLAVGAVTSLVSNIVGLVRGLPGKARSALSGLGGILSSVLSGAFSKAVSAVSNGVSRIGSAINKIPGILKGAVSTAGSAAKSIGTAIVNGIVSGLKKTVGAVGDLGSAVTRMVKDAINGALNLPFNVKIHIPIPAAPDVNWGPKTIIPRFAKGTTGFGGGTALVGEVGPELVTMGRGSNVITNKNLIGFMKQVAALTKAMASGTSGGNSSGGNIQYVVSADFRGDPKSSGVAFAANIAAGLINGLKTTQPTVDSTMAGMASSMSQSFADILEINSPSKVFQKYAGFVGQGFINGLVANVEGVRKAATAMGQAAILAIAKTVTDGQLKLEAVRGEAEAYADRAAEIREQAKNKKLSKRQKKRLEAEAKALDRQAKKKGNIASKQAAAVEAQNAAAERAEAYTSADTKGKSDMKKEDAAAAAAAASAARQRAIKLAKEADLVRKKDKKRAKALDAQSKAALAQANAQADAANKYAAESYRLALEAKAEEDRAAAEEAAALAAELQKQIQSVSAEDVLKAQAAYEAYEKSLQNAQALTAKDAPPQEIKFEQNNYSPEAISAADAYRNGKSLVSIAEQKLVKTP